MVTLYGKSVFQDICIGKIYYFSRKETEVKRYQIDNPEAEIEL